MQARLLVAIFQIRSPGLSDVPLYTPRYRRVQSRPRNIGESDQDADPGTPLSQIGGPLQTSFTPGYVTRFPFPCSFVYQ